MKEALSSLPLCLGGTPDSGLPVPPSLVKTPCSVTRSRDPEEAEEELLQVRGRPRGRRPPSKGDETMHGQKGSF